MRWLAAFLSLLLALAMAHGSAAALPGTGGTFISGGDLTGSVRLAFADEDAFFRRLSLPPQLEAAPSAAAGSYTVRSGYWNEVVPDDEDDRPAAAAAFYYPSGGYVRAQQGDTAVWLVLDLRQRAILDRYIRLGSAGQLTAAPSLLSVLVTAAESEPLSVAVGSRPLSASEVVAFWAATSAYQFPIASVPSAASRAELDGEPEAVWLTIGLPEGRSVRLRYLYGRALLLDPFSLAIYAVPPGWLEPVLGADAPRPGQVPPSDGLDLAGEPGRGSPIYWLLVPLGIVAVASAFWLQRRLGQAD